MSTSIIDAAMDQIASKNYSAALELLRPLAESGNPEAICNLAVLYQCGLGVEVDGSKAVALYLQVAELNIRERCLSGIAYNNLATIFITGLPGIERDLQKAAKYEELAKELGFNM